jgi:hypothetical protein
MINGIEVFGASTACTTVPSAPTGLTATATSSSVDRLDLDRGNSTGQLLDQFVQRLRWDDRESDHIDCERCDGYDLLQHRPRGFDNLLLRCKSA